jgi:tRNA 5-methylaminomethyl-2-thiouridine biosynthesis bifunctional protein
MPDVHFYEVAYEGIRQGQLRRYPAARYVPGLYVHLGLGSRGLTTALLSAELIASQVAGDPLPLERSLVELVHPGRFFMRALRYDRQLIPAP